MLQRTGHSITLIAATLAQWRVSATGVDVVIALTLVLVGAVPIIGRPTTLRGWGIFGAVVLVFGLIHGMGLSTRLQDLHVTELSRMIAFNIGIELGQMAAIVTVAAIASFLARRLN